MKLNLPPNIKRSTITLFLLSSPIILSSQEKITVDLFLDPKLALIEDDHGNKPFTFNPLVNVSVQLKKRPSGYFFFGQSIEYANLFGGKYLRYSIIQAGYTFNEPFFTDRFETSIAVNYGITRRWSRGFTNYGGTLDFSYRISNRLKLASLFQLVRRTDIENPLSSPPIFRYSFFLGIKLDTFSINNVL